MGMITGCLCLVCFCILAVKALTRKFNFTRMDEMVMRAHKPASAGFLIICMLHIIFAFPVLKVHHIVVPITGILSVIVSVLLIALCHMIKDQRRNLAVHRMLSVIILCCMIGHVVMHVLD